ncbi:cadherin EGF LAG seven-pass G-type receptor 3 [Fistulifera solaris]|uniref:Cadherin EGF LAG seven-pass G-type receptor 3 n=1 Tax=Fistulifera solaris TaxID=1519565 RepID=A0A1Z5K162_FISSO|nr:cadherin EGF LAG seven-pass G-type receptor 3 [Fistulifera solaris]|eukprot:GAX19987.1 cadherin EGF LAG seven-pass G-type receptor 3 [Fistulifera solaris]
MSGRVDCNPDATIYCLNGGYCTQGDFLGCRCTGGYSGQHCEIDPPPCTLECSNGGVCTTGDSRHNFEWPGEKPEDGIFCSCPKGFGGFYCEYEADICGNYHHVCLHGTKCQRNDETNSYSCVCDKTSERCIEKLETQFCMPATDIALIGLDVVEYYGGMAVPSFCMNGGKCKAIFIDGDWHSACECLPLFTGPHCEYIRTSNEIRIAGNAIYGFDDEAKTRKALGGLLAVVATCLAVGIILCARQVRRIIKRHNQPAAQISLQGFRKKYDEDEFFGALSPNGNMLFPGFNGGRTFDDRETEQEEVINLSDVFLH